MIIYHILVGIALLAIIKQLFNVKVWLHTKTKRNPKLRIGYLLDKGNQEVPEVHLAGRPKSAPIGRVRIGENDDNAYVEIAITDANDDSLKQDYRDFGYLTQEGIIYRQQSKSKRPEKIGYTARPSAPNEPTVVGERTWRTLWLKCSLNAYKGEPQKTSKKHKDPIATCSYTGIHSSKYDSMPAEARGAVFAMLFGLYNKKDYHEYYNSPAYGWQDTALLASFIYAIAYTMYYIVYVKVLGNSIVGYNPLRVRQLYLLYLAIWTIVRAIKIEFIENSNTIQPKIDLFNKSLSQRGFDVAILVCCVLIFSFSNIYYRLEFVALAASVATGIIMNMRMKSSSLRWEINDPFKVSDKEDDEEELENPEGDIARFYEWNHEIKKYVHGSVTLFYTAQYIADLRYTNPFYSQRKDKPIRVQVLDMFHYMKEHRTITARLRYLVSQIKVIAKQNGLTSDEELLQFTLDFVQEPNIRFCMNRESKPINQFEDYIRYPDEVLYDKEADSNSKALLAAMLFHFMEYNVLFLYSRVQHHGAIGIEVKNEWIIGERIFNKELNEITFMHNNKRYIFCETTSDNFLLGGTMEGMRYDDFDEQIELLLHEEDVEESDSESVTCLYNWDLDSEFGNSLHGCYTLEFDRIQIEELRQNNPFQTYGLDNSTYDENIRKIFAYLEQDDERMFNVREIANYIRDVIKKNDLPELDLVQFALDFCQAPNIVYRVDNESAGIKFAKEYMRYPDEVLFDKEGDCDCKSSLTAALFHELGYNVIVMLSSKLQHAAIGIESKPEWLKAINPVDISAVQREYDGKKYLYCETTGDGFRIGKIKENESIQDFETIVEIVK